MGNAKIWILGVVVFPLSLQAVGFTESPKIAIETDTVKSAEKVQYMLKFTKGLSYEIRVIEDMNSISEKFSAQRLTGVGYVFDVNSVDEQGNAVVDCTVNWIKFKQRGHGGIPENPHVDYDSSDENHQMIPVGEDFGNEIAFMFPRMLREYLNKKFTIRITPGGRVLEITGLDTMIESMAEKGDKKHKKEMSKEEVTAFLKAFFLSPLAVYPEKPVGIGDSWARTGLHEHEQFYKHYTLTLKARKDGVATIEVDAVLNIPQSMGQARSHGQIEINESTGQILRSQISQGVSSEKGKSMQVSTIEMKKL